MPSRRVTPEVENSLSRLLARMVTDIVKDPSRVTLKVESSPHRLVIRFSTAESDSGRVIGARGKTIKAIQEVLEASARTQGVRVELYYENDRRHHRA